MIRDPAERLRLTLTARDLTIPLSIADEHRLLLWIDRFNRQAAKDGEDPLDPNDDDDVSCAVLCCMGAGLAEDERDHGLEGMPWGDVVSVEVADAMRRDRA